LGKADAGIEPAEEGGARKPASLKPAEIVTCAKKQGVLVASDFDPTIAAARASLLYGNVILRVLGAQQAATAGLQPAEFRLLAALLTVVGLALGSVAGWLNVAQIVEFNWLSGWP
jgi:predicted lysophospholipase L1 biosynthesis ABC-type transport system permease subunit